MQFKKRTLSQATQGYCITSLPILGQNRIIAAPEAAGPTLVFTAPNWECSVLATEPGGCMGFAMVPGRSDAMFMITKFYPIFKSEEAGVHLYQATDGLDTPWTGQRIIDLPFVHRISVVGNGMENFLVAASVCEGKDFQDDWSKPGAVYVAKIQDGLASPWELKPILEGIHQNHGMQVREHEGKPCVYVAATEGVFRLEVPAAGQSEWHVTQLLDHKVSELYLADLDGDGQDEMAVIEPFHGKTMSVYKNENNTWQKIYSAALAFGHGLWAGTFGTEQAVFAGNRSDDANLACFKVVSLKPFNMEESVVDAGSGTTNLDVIQTAQGPALITSNPGHEEYALYYAVSKD